MPLKSYLKKKNCMPLKSNVKTSRNQIRKKEKKKLGNHLNLQLE